MNKIEYTIFLIVICDKASCPPPKASSLSEIIVQNYIKE